jgi:hypothetical protein
LLVETTPSRPRPWRPLLVSPPSGGQDEVRVDISCCVDTWTFKQLQKHQAWKKAGCLENAWNPWLWKQPGFKNDRDPTVPGGWLTGFEFLEYAACSGWATSRKYQELCANYEEAHNVRQDCHHMHSTTAWTAVKVVAGWRHPAKKKSDIPRVKAGSGWHYPSKEESVEGLVCNSTFTDAAAREAVASEFASP